MPYPAATALRPTLTTADFNFAIAAVFLSDLLVVFLVAGAAVYLFHLLRVPPVVGLLVAGVIVGPHGLRLVGGESDERVQVLAEVGVVVLLFTVGLEFSLSKLLSMTRMMGRVGLPQIAICVAVTAAATWSYYGALNQAVFTGMLVAMSSTAIALKIMADRGELSALHSRLATAVLLLQDLLVVVFVLVVPLLAAEAPASNGQSAHGGPIPTISPWLAMLRGLVVVVGILVAGRLLIPGLLFQIVRTRNRELFLIAIFVICIGTATITGLVGLSLALGAFLAGLTLAESEYGHQTLAEVLPFRDTLSSLFFVSVGMLLDVRFLAANAGLLAVCVVALVALKFVSVAMPALLGGYSLRTAVLAGLATAQIGEFSFVLAQSGLQYRLISPDHYQAVLAAAVLTMCLTPFLIAGGPRLVNALSRVPSLAKWLDDRRLDEQLAKTNFSEHVVIAGYGLNGRNLAAALRELQIPYVVLETNPETVRLHRIRGESILFGDCTRPALLEHANIEAARAYVVGISDPVSTRRTVQTARQLNDRVHILVRTRYESEVDDLRALGANEIIPEEFEASLEIFALVLREYQVPGNIIDRFIAGLRGDHYRAFRSEHLGREHLQIPKDLLGEADIETCLIETGSSAIEKTIAELRLRTRSGATVVAVRREEQLLTNPGGEFRIAPGDVAMLLGKRDQIDKAMEILTAADPPPGT